MVIKQCLAHAAPLDFAALRAVIGTLTLFALMLYKRRPLRPRAVGTTMLVGLVSTTGCIGLVTWSTAAGAVGKTAILTYFMPFWALILAWPVLSEKIRGMQWAAVLLAFIGLVVILEPWKMEPPGYASMLAIISGMVWAVSVILIKRVRRTFDFDLLSLTAWQMLFGTLPFLVLALIVPTPKIDWSAGFIVGLTFSAVVSQGFALLLWFYILQELPAGTAGMGTLSTPVIGILAAGIQLGERPSVWESLGMILILGGLAVLALQGVIQSREIARILKRR